jgi:hypothetical protein
MQESHVWPKHSALAFFSALRPGPALIGEGGSRKRALKMKNPILSAIIAIIVASMTVQAQADGNSAYAWTQRRPMGFPPFSALNFYSSPRHPVRYYRACGYGDCPCLRSIALATRSQVWWDRYSACTG